MALKRINKELKDLMGTPIENVIVVPDDSNVLKWEVTMNGPAGTPYEGGKFGLNVTFVTEYPFKPPTIKFANKIYHPNIDSEGSICVGILKADAWKPNVNMRNVLFSLYDLLQTPNPNDPLEASIADLYINDRPAFDAKAREYTKKFAV